MLLCLQLALLFCLLLATLFLAFPWAARGHLLSTLSFSSLHTLRVVSCCSCLRALSLSTCCVWMRRCSLESMPALCARHWCRSPAGTTHAVWCRVSKGFQADVSHVVVAVVHRGLALPSRSLARQANPLWAVMYHTSATLLTPAAVAAVDQVPRGQQAPFDQFHTLVLDPVSGIGGVFSACWRQTLASLPRAPDSQRPRVASRKHCRCEAPVLKGLSVLLVGAHCRLILSFSSRFISVLSLSSFSTPEVRAATVVSLIMRRTKSDIFPHVLF